MNQRTSPSTNGGPGRSARENPFLSLHTAVVLLAAFAVGMVIGGLTLLTGVPAAGAVLAGVSAAGSAVPVLRPLIGVSSEDTGP